MIINEDRELTEAERVAKLSAEMKDEEVEEVEVEEVEVEEDIKPYIQDQNGKIYEFKPLGRATYSLISKYLNKASLGNFEKAVEKIMYVQHGMPAAEYNELLNYLYEEEGIGNVQVLLGGIINSVVSGKKTKNKYVEQAIAKAMEKVEEN